MPHTTQGFIILSTLVLQGAKGYLCVIIRSMIDLCLCDTKRETRNGANDQVDISYCHTQHDHLSIDKKILHHTNGSFYVSHS